MSKSNSMQLVNERGWRCGFLNMLRKENDRWWGRGRQWLSHGLVWLLLINGLLAINLWVMPIIQNSDWAQARAAVDPEVAARLSEEMAPPVDMFMTYMGVMPIFGMIIIAQSAIVGEKKSGTAEWIFSNPVSRSAFILSKLIATAIGIFTTVILLQGLVAYGQIGLSGEWVSIIPYMWALSLHSLHLFFYLTLTLMLGTFFSGRSPVLGIPFAVYIGQFLVEGLLKPFLPELLQFLPARLPDQATQLIMGESITSPNAIIATALYSALFVVVAIIRFKREEF